MGFVTLSYTSVGSYCTYGVGPSSQSSKTLFWSFLAVYGRQLCFPLCYATINNIVPYIILIKTLSPSRWRGCFNTYSSKVYFRKLHRALRTRRSTSMDKSAIVVDVLPEVYKLVRWLYTWPAASTLNMAVDYGIPFAPKHMILILSSDTVRPNAVHTTAITAITFLSCSGKCETTLASSA